jgi:peptidoglycan/xylan/chitin deacetylase (PgdA/CDA1 family)
LTGPPRQGALTPAQEEYERLRRGRRAREEWEHRQRARRHRKWGLAVLAAISVAAGAAVGASAGGGERTGQPPGAVPMLMYHVLGEPPAGSQFPELFVKNSSFEAELRWLDRRGYEAITLDQLYQGWRGDRATPDKPVVISFDDGYRSQYSEGLPALHDLDWPGVLNLKVNTLTQGELTDDQVDEMIRDGWEVDSHTINHLDVSKLAGKDLQSEIAGSRAILQKRFRVPVDFFCYPAGRYDKAAVREVKRAGYLGATTTKLGLARPDQLFALRRIRISPGDGVRGLAAKLREAKTAK